MTIIQEISTTDAKTRFYQDVPDNIYSTICSSTNCINGNLSNMAKFLLLMYKRNGMDGLIEHANKAYDTVNRVKKYPQMLARMNNEVCDIKRDYDAFSVFLDNFNADVDAEDEAKGKCSMIFKVPCEGVDIVAPLNFETANKLWGGRTDWCTAKDRDDFNHYCDESCWIFVINNRYQIQVGKDGTIMQYRDDCDNEIINSAEYLVCGECDGEYIEHDEFIEKFKEYKEETGEDDDYDALWSFLENRCNYEPFHGEEWIWNFNGEFIADFGEGAYNAIMSSLQDVISKGCSELQSMNESAGVVIENALPEDENGNYYHGTGNGWNVESGFIECSGPIWFADYERYADDYVGYNGRTIVAKLDVKNPFDAGEIDTQDDMVWDTTSKDSSDDWHVIRDENEQADSTMFKQLLDYAEKLNVDVWELVGIYEWTDWDCIFNLTRTPEFVELCKNAGYDAIKATESGNPTIGVFSNEQIKITNIKQHECMKLNLNGLKNIIRESVEAVIK